jgi:hypothetical protein
MGSVPTQTWQDICEEAIKAVVTILMYYPRPFDTEDTGCSEATGFVLDAKRGIILTNRVRLLFFYNIWNSQAKFS